jgi:hypothetical protein
VTGESISTTNSNTREKIVYGSLTCTAEDGESGCECIQVDDNDDCSMPSKCQKSSVYHNYNTELHLMFTEEEIRERVHNMTPILEQTLKNALKADGFPIK